MRHSLSPFSRLTLIGIILTVSVTALTLPALLPWIRTERLRSESARARKIFAEAERQRAVWEEGALRQAIKRYEEAAAIWLKTSDKSQAMNAFRESGNIFALFRESVKAVELYNQALTLARELNDQQTEREILNGIGRAWFFASEYQKATEFCRNALSLSRAVGDVQNEVTALNILGDIHYDLGDLPQAQSFYEQALTPALNTADIPDQAWALQGLGGIYTDLSQSQKALNCYLQAIPLWQMTGNKREEGITRIYLGNLYSKLGEKQKALDCFEQAESIVRLMGDRLGYGWVLAGRAYVYDELGDKQRALETHLEALQLVRDVCDFLSEAAVLLSIGAVQLSLGDPQQAQSNIEQSLSIARRLGNPRLEAYAIGQLGNVYAALEKKKEAAEHYQRSLTMLREVKDPRQEAHTLADLGALHVKHGEWWQARVALRQALALNRRTLDRFGETATLYHLARLERGAGNLIQARAHLAAASELIESLRTSVVSHELRTTYFTSVQDYYDLYVDVLMRLHQRRPAARFDVEAVAISERSRARTMLDQLTEARLGIREGADPELLLQERLVISSLDGKVERKGKILVREHKPEEIAQIDREIAELNAQYNDIQVKIRIRSPRYAALMKSRPLRLHEIQRELPDDGTMLLECKLGNDSSWLFAITRRSFASYGLPARDEIEARARRVYELLTTRQRQREGETPVEWRARVRQSDADYWQAADELSRIIFGEVAPQLGQRRLIFVGEGPLQFVPLAALPKPVQEERGTPDSRPFILDHVVTNLPSGSVIPVLRKLRVKRLPGAKAVAVLADPVFGKDDSRLKPASAEKPQAAINRPGQTGAAYFGKNEARGISFFVPEAQWSLAGGGAQAEPPEPTYNFRSALKGRQSIAQSVALPGLVSQSVPVVALALHYQLSSALPRGFGGFLFPESSRHSSAQFQSFRDYSYGPKEENFPRLFGTRDEARAISSLVGPESVKVWQGFEVTRALVTGDELKRYRIVHFATHGRADSQYPELSSLILSLYDQQGEKQDGILRLADVFNLKLSADLVVLSACSAAMGKEVKGEGLVALARAFFYAGADRVVASVWKVSDDAAVELMRGFYERMLRRRMIPAEALRDMQLTLRQDERWQAPFYWAAFVLQGEYR
jgi:tetratricopeptide (TPR) repeat protein